MTPQPGQLIRAFFRNSSKIEGFVIEWSAQQSTIQAVDGSSILIIQKTIEDVMAVEIILSASVSQPQSILPNHPLNPTQLENKFQNIQQQPNNDSRLPRLAKLKTVINNNERQKLAAFLQAGKKIENNYEFPGFFKKPITK